MTREIRTELITFPGGATVNKQYVYTYNDNGVCVSKEAFDTDSFSTPIISVSGASMSITNQPNYLVQDATDISNSWPPISLVTSATTGVQTFFTGTGSRISKNSTVLALISLKIL
jgi:hypothetical protein